LLFDQRPDRGWHDLTFWHAPTPTVRVIPDEAASGQEAKKLEREQRISERVFEDPSKRLTWQPRARLSLEQRIRTLTVQWRKLDGLHAFGWPGTTRHDQSNPTDSHHREGQLLPELKAFGFGLVQILYVQDQRCIRGQQRSERF
jgi:hypothetical protein